MLQAKRAIVCNAGFGGAARRGSAGADWWLESVSSRDLRCRSRRQIVANEAADDRYRPRPGGYSPSTCS